MIAGVTVKKREQLATCSGVYNLIDAREIESLLRAVLVEICVINAHPPFFILLLNKHRVG
jgi:ribosome biogenesis GTPase A